MPAIATIPILRLGSFAAAMAGVERSSLPASLLAAINAAPANSGRIAAVFETTFYIEARDGRFLCVGGPETGDGPLNAIAATLPGGDWTEAGIADGMPVAFEAGRIVIGSLQAPNGPTEAAGAITLDLRHSTIWKPARWPSPVVPETLSVSLAALHDLMRARAAGRTGSPFFAAGAPATQLSARDTPSRIIERRATLSIATLADWLEYHLSGSAELDDAGRDAVHGLIGLGSGLTPSGDDLIAGLLIALHAAARSESAAALSAFVRAAPAAATSKLSRALLEAAMAGSPSDAMHQMIAALLSGDTAALPRCLARLEAIGHTSGTDMLAGALLGLTAIAALHAAAGERPQP